MQLAMGCALGNNAASKIAPTPSVTATGQSKCNAAVSQSRPLIVEWPSSDRAALEARIRKGLVPVRYNGCEMEVLTNCTYRDDSYNFFATTGKREQVRIRDTDDLYARLPVGAARLEAELARAGELNVEMTIVGRYEASTYSFGTAGLEGRCDTATHVITGLTVGAFRFYSGASADISGSAGVATASGNVGGGGSSTTERTKLAEDGNLEACVGSASDALEPPEGCGALLRVEVAALDGSGTPAGGTTGAGAAEGPPRIVVDAKQAEDDARGQADWKKTKRGLGIGTGLFFGGIAVMAPGVIVAFNADEIDGEENPDEFPDEVNSSAEKQRAALGGVLAGVGGAAMFVGMGMIAVYGVRFIRQRPKYGRRFTAQTGVTPLIGGGALTISGSY